MAGHVDTYKDTVLQWAYSGDARQIINHYSTVSKVYPGAVEYEEKALEQRKGSLPWHTHIHTSVCLCVCVCVCVCVCRGEQTDL